MPLSPRPSGVIEIDPAHSLRRGNVDRDQDDRGRGHVENLSSKNQLIPTLGEDWPPVNMPVERQGAESRRGMLQSRRERYAVFCRLALAAFPTRKGPSCVCGSCWPRLWS